MAIIKTPFSICLGSLVCQLMRDCSWCVDSILHCMYLFTIGYTPERTKVHQSTGPGALTPQADCGFGHAWNVQVL
jgi:hypothetical protein